MYECLGSKNWNLTSGKIDENSSSGRGQPCAPAGSSHASSLFFEESKKLVTSAKP